MKHKKILINIILIIFFIQITLIIIKLYKSIYKYFLIKELNLQERYGQNSYALITGASSGQGKQFAIKLAQRKFNLLLIGSVRTLITKEYINNNYPNVDVKVIIKDFRMANNEDFFQNIQNEINNLDISILINNVGYRIAWNPYHEMPSQLIYDSINVGCIVQSKLTQMIIPKFINRNKKSALVNITAQCLHPTFIFGITTNNEITVPYLSVYEAANAYGYYHGCSIYEEYKDRFDILNIMPGAVITENTEYLKNTMFNINSECFVNQVIKMLGNIQGSTCAYIGHSLSTTLINFFPVMKKSVLKKVGEIISNDFINNYHNNKNKYNINY